MKLKSLKHAPTFALKIQQTIYFKILFLTQPKFFDLTPFRLLEKNWRDILKLKQFVNERGITNTCFSACHDLNPFQNTTSELREGMHIHVMANYQVHLSMYDLRKLDISFKSLLSLSIHQLISSLSLKSLQSTFFRDFIAKKKKILGPRREKSSACNGWNRLFLWGLPISITKGLPLRLCWRDVPTALENNQRSISKEKK